MPGPPVLFFSAGRTMKIGDLIRHFADREDLPIEPTEVARVLMEAGIEEEIIFLGVEYDVGVLRGLLVQTTEPRSAYEPGNGNISKVFYATNQPSDWQRLVCCKELLHILDPDRLQTRSREDVAGLVTKIVLPPELQALAEGKIDSNSMQALSDHFADVRAVALLFPLKARELLLPKYTTGAISADEIVRIVGIPERYVHFAMSEFWPAVYGVIVNG